MWSQSNVAPSMLWLVAIVAVIAIVSGNIQNKGTRTLKANDESENRCDKLVLSSTGITLTALGGRYKTYIFGIYDFLKEDAKGNNIYRRRILEKPHTKSFYIRKIHGYWTVSSKLNVDSAWIKNTNCVQPNSPNMCNNRWNVTTNDGWKDDNSFSIKCVDKIRGCKFENGDGTGGNEKLIGNTNSDDECAALVHATQPTANGVTHGGYGCYAEFNASSTSGPYDRYKTCRFDVCSNSSDCPFGYACTNGQCTPCTVEGQKGDGTKRGTCGDGMLCYEDGGCDPPPDG